TQWTSLEKRFSGMNCAAGLENDMKRWILRVFFLGVLGLAGFWAYDFYRAGYLSLPDLPDGAYTLSYKTGFRAIVLDADVPDTMGHDAPKYFRSLGVANPDRKYLGIPFDVQPWFREAWSWCKSPTEQERANLGHMPD